MLQIDLKSWDSVRGEASRIRTEVFVKEQAVPPELEMDAHDALSLHALALQDGKAVATGRLLPDGHIGRMAVLKDWRGRGIGGALLQRLIEAARRRGDAEIVLAAQTRVLPFYRAHGFMERGATYIEAGIEHQDMALEPKTALLAEGALLAGKVSEAHCGELPYGGHCGRTHAIWPALKLMRQVGSPAADAAFYRGVFAGLPASAAPLRTLISGSSDYGILEQVLTTAAGRRLEVTVTDACETPLVLSRWYAERAGCAIATRKTNILDFKADAPFDLIFAHGFIEQLPVERRPALAALWQRLLARDGHLVFVSIVRNLAEAEVERAARRSTAEVRAIVEKANETLPLALRLPLDATIARLERFWDSRAPSDLRSEEEVIQLLETAGFSLGQIAEGYAEVPGRAGLGRSRRVRLVGRRR